MAEKSIFFSSEFNKNSDDIFSNFINISTNNDLFLSQFNNNENFFVKPEFNFLDKKIKEKKIFNTENNNLIDKNIINKRLKNKIAAKKFRNKKKKYIENLEKNLIIYKNELKELKFNLNDIKKEKNYYLILKDYENKIQNNNNNNNFINNKDIKNIIKHNSSIIKNQNKLSSNIKTNLDKARLAYVAKNYQKKESNQSYSKDNKNSYNKTSSYFANLFKSKQSNNNS